MFPGTAAKPMRTIGHALDTSVKGDTVRLRGGHDSPDSNGEVYTDKAGAAPQGAGRRVRAGRPEREGRRQGQRPLPVELRHGLEATSGTQTLSGVDLARTRIRLTGTAALTYKPSRPDPLDGERGGIFVTPVGPAVDVSGSAKLVMDGGVVYGGRAKLRPQPTRHRRRAGRPGDRARRHAVHRPHGLGAARVGDLDGHDDRRARQHREPGGLRARGGPRRGHGRADRHRQHPLGQPRRDRDGDRGQLGRRREDRAHDGRGLERGGGEEPVRPPRPCGSPTRRSSAPRSASARSRHRAARRPRPGCAPAATRSATTGPAAPCASTRRSRSAGSSRSGTR